jgi:hypothetical protein
MIKYNILYQAYAYSCENTLLPSGTNSPTAIYRTGWGEQRERLGKETSLIGYVKGIDGVRSGQVCY